MGNEAKRISTLLKRLLNAKRSRFPKNRERLQAPDLKGVYIIYSPSDQVLHVGQTPRGKRGLKQRLNNHLHGASSFTTQYLNGKGSLLRRGYSYRCLPIADDRQRALVEMLGVGTLCPKHLGLGLLKVAG